MYYSYREVSGKKSEGIRVIKYDKKKCIDESCKCSSLVNTRKLVPCILTVTNIKKIYFN